ncbi:hypothetical protein HPB51_004550 [Rhipicephalus microplus]|uniref:Uncharacterized protein n=1 Tax=Rhipicephalus microplus TaxID=6941 RepID=A0A9J6EMI4_RHIMP|nr:hypothetical protein HPB51_004550 [Rhipicephalus microplus]
MLDDFVFIVFIVQMLQLFPDLLFSVSGGNAILTTDTWTAQAFNASTLHAPDILLFVAVESVLRHYKATSAIDLQAAPPRITTTTKAPAPNNAGCGHSGTQAMRTLNPFVFIVQIPSAYNDKKKKVQGRDTLKSSPIVLETMETEAIKIILNSNGVSENRASPKPSLDPSLGGDDARRACSAELPYLLEYTERHSPSTKMRHACVASCGKGAAVESLRGGIAPWEVPGDVHRCKSRSTPSRRADFPASAATTVYSSLASQEARGPGCSGV